MRTALSARPRRKSSIDDRMDVAARRALIWRFPGPYLKTYVEIPASICALGDVRLPPQHQQPTLTHNAGCLYSYPMVWVGIGCAETLANRKSTSLTSSHA